MISTSIQQELQRGINNGTFPGAVALIGYQDGTILTHQAAGNLEPDGDPMAIDTTFDLASISKPCGTVMLLMRLVEQNRLDLDAPVFEYLPHFRTDKNKETVKICHLLTHTSGLPWWMPFYQKYTSGNPEAPKPNSQEAKRDTLDRAAAAPLEAIPGQRAVYSDLNFLLLGDIIERLYQTTQDQAYHQEVVSRLHTGCHYRPISKGPWPNAAPTEICTIRQGRVRDVVHDENTWTMGGVAGHAGLFGTAKDLFTIACALKPGAFVSQKTLSQFWPDTPPFAGTYVLGWDTPSPTLSGAGCYFSFKSVGHTGFTGTSLWIDRERNLVSILLTNRVYFGRQNEQIKPYRRAFHDVVGQALGWPQLRPE